MSYGSDMIYEKKAATTPDVVSQKFDVTLAQL